MNQGVVCHVLIFVSQILFNGVTSQELGGVGLTRQNERFGGNGGGIPIGTTFPGGGGGAADNTFFVDAPPALTGGRNQGAGRPGFCYLPRLTGNCRGRFLSYFYDGVSRRCRAFFYSGCQGNENRFQNLQECQRICGNGGAGEDVCTLPVTAGPCRASMRRFYFNSASGQCEIFRYGGCQGNRNNFQSLQACQRRCVSGNGDIFPPGSPCNLPHAQSGNCNAFFPSWTFNPVTRQCQEFIYGGCGGNRNRFNSRQDCRRACVNGGGGDVTPGVCRLTVAPGPCRAFIPRWSYSMMNGQCERFIYGGCAGNGNNFQSRQQCEDACSNAGGGGIGNQICLLPEDSGPCMATIPRWHYNARFRRCERFLYGGCQGNENNFETWGQCQRVCRIG
ncbi:actinia tenebrosa protease inhibitors-like isoform X1 [Crassostrea virginica]